MGDINNKLIEDLFDYSNSMADWVKNSPDAYQLFLKTAAHTEHFTVANKLLIQGYMQCIPPVYLADEADWMSSGYTIRQDAIPIYVMEHAPGKHTGYDVRKMYDITATNAEYEMPVYDKSFLLDALMLNAPCNIEYVDKLPAKALYSPDKDVIQMTKGFKSFEEIFFVLSQEYSHHMLYHQMEKLAKGKSNEPQIKLKYTRGANIFTAFSTAYMLCEKYNMLPGNINIKSLPEGWQYLKAMDFKHELTNIDDVFKEINKGMEEKLNMLYRGDEAIVE